MKGKGPANSRQDNTNILKQSTIFSVLNNSEITELMELISEHRYTTNEYVFWEGDASEWFYIVAEGKIRISKLASTGKETIIAFFGRGEMFGEVAVFENKPYPASALATTETRLLGVKRVDFLNFLMNHPEVSLRIIGILSGRLRDSQNRLRDLAGERVEQRLARTLIMLSAKLGNELPFTRQELSDMAGTTTETTIRIFSQWKDREVLDSVRGKIIITNTTKLRLLAEGPPQF